MAESIADPTKYDNLFPGYAESLKVEQFQQERAKILTPAAETV